MEGCTLFKSRKEFREEFIKELETSAGKSVKEASNLNAYRALISLINEKINSNWMKTTNKYINNNVKQAYYFSIEYLPGKFLYKNLRNLGILNICEKELKQLGFDLNELESEEAEAGLGNGGLGRLASCFMDSLASLQLPGHGYGIRYKFGLFEQKIVDGYQIELPDNWLSSDYLWEIKRPDQTVEVKFGGDVNINPENGDLQFELENYETVKAVPYDIALVGYQNNTFNTLRLWSAESAIQGPYEKNERIDDRYKYLDYNRTVESISQFLYPDDTTYEGKLTKLKQQYFLCSAGLQDVFRTFDKYDLPYDKLPKKVALHVNDTHPALLIPELMRILLDEKNYSWEKAWKITVNCVSYTNHTIMSEAMEEWSVQLIKNLLPRIYMIIEEINERFCQKLWENYSASPDKIKEMAIIADDQVKMAHLSIVGSHSINGVSKLHSDILKKDVMKSFYQVYPEQFNNKTNGVTHRRWLLQANPKLSELITDYIGKGWIEKPDYLEKLLEYKDSEKLQNRLEKVKKQDKEKLADYIKEKQGIEVNTESIFDIHVKRIHAYKRQIMNCFHIMHLYNKLKENPDLDITPRTFIFAGKAASTYYLAKRIIKLINNIASVINNDDSINNKIKVVFLENYSVTLAQKIIPAGDISEQISTASKEASGTGNMKFMMNGALTLGTLDGANVKIHELVGDDNIFIFGLKADEVLEYYNQGGYSARELYYSDSRIKKVMEQLITSSPFIGGGEDFQDIYNFILNDNDIFFILKDFDSYVEAQKVVGQTYRSRQQWLQKCIVNISKSGFFSTDRTITEYADDIWEIKPLSID